MEQVTARTSFLAGGIATNIQSVTSILAEMKRFIYDRAIPRPMTDQDIQTQSKSSKKFSFYENFDGHHHKVNEIRDLITQFKAFYYAQQREDPTRIAITIINAFNGQILPFSFFPRE